MEVKMEPRKTELDIGIFFHTEDDELFFVVEDSDDVADYPIKIIDMNDCTINKSFENVRELRKHYEGSVYTIYEHNNAELNLR